jgi:hypothetical protein
MMILFLVVAYFFTTSQADESSAVVKIHINLEGTFLFNQVKEPLAEGLVGYLQVERGTIKLKETEITEAGSVIEAEITGSSIEDAAILAAKATEFDGAVLQAGLAGSLAKAGLSGLRVSTETLWEARTDSPTLNPTVDPTEASACSQADGCTGCNEIYTSDSRWQTLGQFQSCIWDRSGSKCEEYGLRRVRRRHLDDVLTIDTCRYQPQPTLNPTVDPTEAKAEVSWITDIGNTVLGPVISVNQQSDTVTIIAKKPSEFDYKGSLEGKNNLNAYSNTGNNRRALSSDLKTHTKMIHIGSLEVTESDYTLTIPNADASTYEVRWYLPGVNSGDDFISAFRWDSEVN